MKSKVVKLPAGYFYQEKQRPLSKSMIKTLKQALEKQRKGIAFGPDDINGSLMPLVKRGLIQQRVQDGKNNPSPTWFVTDECIQILKDLGIKIPE